MDGARRAFTRLGYEATRVEDILQEAGVSRPTFYRVFRNKDEVFAEVTDEEVPRQRSARERVLEGAREAFGRLGYEATRVEDILEASGVSRPTFYRMFASKQDAYAELDCIAVGYLSRAVTQLARGEPLALEHLELVVASYFEWRVGLRVFLRPDEPRNDPPGLAPFRLEQRALESDRDPMHTRVLAVVLAIDALSGSFFDDPSPGLLALRRSEALELARRWLVL